MRKNLAPDTRAIAIRIKKRPRGKSFEAGNGYGAEFRFKKGMPSANPSGRPRCKEISKALRQRLESEKSLPAKTGAEKIAKVWEEQARRGNIAAIVSLANRVEGCPATTIVNNGPDNLDVLIGLMNEEHEQLGSPEGMRMLPSAEIEEATP
jgi:hypothetical protein